MRSLNVARQIMDLYVCLRPVRWFTGVPSPVKTPEKVDMVIFRENTEDIYSGIEWEAGSDGAKKMLAFLKQEFPEMYKRVRFPETSAIGIKPVSQEGTERLVRAAIRYAIAEKRKSVTFVHKGNIMKFTEGGFRQWGYALAEREFPRETYTWEQWGRTKLEKGEEAANAEQKSALASGRILIKDAIADITLQQILTRPDEFDVIATLNLNGDYLSDALAAEVGGIGSPRRQHQLHHRPRRLRRHARNRSQVHQPGQSEPGVRHPHRGNDVPLHGLDRGSRPDHQRHRRRHRRQDRHLRLRAPDGRGHGGPHFQVRRHHHRKDELNAPRDF